MLFVESFKTTQFSLLVETLNRLQLFPYLILLSSRYTTPSLAWFWGRLKFVDVDARLFNLTSKILSNLSSLQHEWCSIKKKVKKLNIWKIEMLFIIAVAQTDRWVGRGLQQIADIDIKRASFKQNLQTSLSLHQIRMLTLNILLSMNVAQLFEYSSQRNLFEK